MTKVEIGETQQPQYSLIFLHGLGADGNDFVPIIPALGLPSRTHCIFPNATHRPVTINGGMHMPAWFDIYGIDENGPIDKSGIEDSISNVQQIIDEEIAKGVKPENIVLAGFSQGGTIALHAGLRYTQKLGGIIALSTYMPLAQELKQLRNESNKTTPVFIAHGMDDTLVPMIYGKNAATLLEEWGNPVTWHQYPMYHSVCNAEIEDIAKWLQARW